MTIRRVVTGRNEDGKDAVLRDEKIEPVEPLPGGFMYSIWGSDEAPTFPADGSEPAHKNMFPPVGGYRFLQISIPPDSRKADATASTDAKHSVPDFDPKYGGMHVSDTVDLEIVLSGEAGIEFDDGAKIYLKPGDILVQNGTRHRWFNRGAIPAVLAIVLIGGHRP